MLKQDKPICYYLSLDVVVCWVKIT